MTQLGTTLVFRTYHDILVTGSGDRELAVALLRRSELLTAIKSAAAILEADGRTGDADALRYPLAPLSKWKPEHREMLRQKAIALLDQGKDLSFREVRGGDWGVEFDANGNVTITGPDSLLCDDVKPAGT